ncbi:MAG: DUF1302 domain-containing protein [Acidiferrobacterales bacterium]|nr:DUF1302 domain-containing protein [Acidiferrobacterales bacterium]
MTKSLFSWCLRLDRPSNSPSKRSLKQSVYVYGLSVIVTFCAVVVALPAHAVELSSGDVEANLDVTLTYGLTARTSKRQDGLSNANTDNGTRNYNRGIVSNTAAITTELGIQQGDFGLFTRAHGFIDYENQNRARVRTPLSSEAKKIAGKDINLLDAYVYGGFDVQGLFFDVRVGSQVLNWGESTFIPNGINVTNPIDVSRIRTPGSELREALIPVPMISASVGLSPNLTVEGFYQFDWKHTEIDPVGTYYSTNDFVGAGGRYAYITHSSLGNVSDTGRIFRLNVAEFNSSPLFDLNGYQLKRHDPHFLAVERAPDNEPKDEGQWGFALRYFAEELNNTEFGLFFIRNHSQLPVVSGRIPSQAEFNRILRMAGSLNNDLGRAELMRMLGPRGESIVGPFTRGLIVDRFAKESNYLVEYPEDIKTIGISFNTALENSGWALQGEYSHHSDVPLQREVRSLFGQALRPVLCLSPNTPDCENSLAQLGNGNQQGYVLGYVRRNVSQLQMTATKIFGSALGSDSTGFVGEMGITHVHDMPDSERTPLETGGAGGGYADATSYGYRGTVWFEYNNAIGAVKLIPYFQFLHDVKGTTPVPVSNFLQGRKVLTFGLGANYLDRWTADLSYTAHSGSRNRLSDRDFLSLSVSYSF